MEERDRFAERRWETSVERGMGSVVCCWMYECEGEGEREGCCCVEEDIAWCGRGLDVVLIGDTML